MPPSLVSEFNDLTAKALADNWSGFRDINGLAGHNTMLDSVMIFSANDLIFLLPLLAALVWLSVARWSPYQRWLRARFGEPLSARARWVGQRIAISAALAVAFALALNILLGALIFEPRPFIANPRAVRQLIPHAADASFPSDHEAVAMSIALALTVAAIWMLWTSLREPLVGRAAGWSWWRALSFTALPWAVALIALASAVLIGFSRVFDGVHYPLDIAGGAICGALGVVLALALLPLADHLYRPIIRLAEALRLT
jgi:undecaprenyl-diphosphatase